MKVGLTGGIGSGKSYICQRLAAHGFTVYDCDAAAKRLIRTSPTLQQQLIELIGSLEKAAISRFLRASEQNAKAIDAIVHPAVFQDFLDSGMEWMESAILFESGISELVDKIVVVTAPEELRIQRIQKRDGISREMAQQWMHRQWPQEKVRSLADFEIVNDGISDIDAQIDTLLQQLSQNV